MSDNSDIRNMFPILKSRVNDNDLVYFDNAATTQKSKEVIKELERFYLQEKSHYAHLNTLYVSP